jgi:hypothetical protein
MAATCFAVAGCDHMRELEVRDDEGTPDARELLAAPMLRPAADRCPFAISTPSTLQQVAGWKMQSRET